jgi:hypothetical protein
MFQDQIDEFNKSNPLDDGLQMNGARPSQNSAFYNFNGQLAFNQYDLYLNGKRLTANVLLDTQTNSTIVLLKDGEALISSFQSSFEIYAYLRWDNDYALAAQWSKDPLIQNYYHHKQQSMMTLSQPPYGQQQQWGHGPQFENFHYQPRSPLIDIDFIMDSNASKTYLKLNQFIYDKNSLLFELSFYMSELCDIPQSTVLVILLTVFSGLTSKKWRCAYKDGRLVSIGLYCVAEQESGVGKSRALGLALEPIIQLVNPKITELKLEIDILQDKIERFNHALAGAETREDKAFNKRRISETKSRIKKLEKNLARVQSFLPITNSTPEALDVMLNHASGFFFAAAAEQGLFNSLLGLSYGKKANNNDLLLNGREGGDVHSTRASRKAYSGKVIGAVVCFAQDRSIEKLLTASGVTGLAERFIMISEPSLLGYRDRIREKVNRDHLFCEYAKKCAFFAEIIEDPNRPHPDLLITLRLCEESWRYIANYENSIEQELRYGGALSNPTLQRVVGKTRMQVMGLAANLYLLDTDDQPLTELDDPYIPLQYVIMAINMFNELLTGVRDYCERRGLISDKAQISTLYGAFIGKGENISYTEQELKKKLEQVKPFRDLNSPRIAIKNTLNFLVQNHVLLEINGRFYRNPEKFSPTYH